VACAIARVRSGKQTLIDPWYDYLAIPIAPLVLVAQLVALFLRRAALRAILVVGAPVLIAGMFVYVSSRPVRADEGVAIGEGVLVLWLLVSLVIALCGVVAEGIRVAAARRKPPSAARRWLPGDRGRPGTRRGRPRRI
jgi:hypothetical protein